jgi:hypothetical protein
MIIHPKKLIKPNYISGLRIPKKPFSHIRKCSIKQMNKTKAVSGNSRPTGEKVGVSREAAKNAKKGETK